MEGYLHRESTCGLIGYLRGRLVRENLPSALMSHTFELQSDGRDLDIGIVVSRYHAWATDRLLAGAVDRFRLLGGDEERVVIASASGAWELTGVARGMCDGDQFDGVVALGVVIQGETPHFSYICDAVTQGLTSLTVQHGIPIGFGVLTCNTREEVEARCGGAIGNKGADAMQAVVESVNTIRAIQHFKAVD